MAERYNYDQESHGFPLHLSPSPDSLDPRVEVLAELLWNYSPILVWEGFNWTEMVARSERMEPGRTQLVEGYRRRARGWLKMIDDAALPGLPSLDNDTIRAGTTSDSAGSDNPSTSEGV